MIYMLNRFIDAGACRRFIDIELADRLPPDNWLLHHASMQGEIGQFQTSVEKPVVFFARFNRKPIQDRF
jgi:hypothetical protein